MDYWLNFRRGRALQRVPKHNEGFAYGFFVGAAAGVVLMAWLFWPIWK